MTIATCKQKPHSNMCDLKENIEPVRSTNLWNPFASTASRSPTQREPDHEPSLPPRRQPTSRFITWAAMFTTFWQNISIGSFSDSVSTSRSCMARGTSLDCCDIPSVSLYEECERLKTLQEEALCTQTCG